MKTIGERLYYFRTEVVHKTRKEFGPPVGMTESEIKNIEYGKTTIRDDKLLLICEVYGICTEWLRTGEGEMYLPKTLGDQMGELAAGAAKNNVEAIRQIFRELPEKFTDAEILMLYQIFKNHWKD